MNDDGYDNDLLFKYLEGELSQAAAEQIEAQLREEPDLRERLERLRLARKAVGHYGLVQQVRAVHREMVPSFRKPPLMVRWRRPILSVAAAFVVVLSMAAFYMYRQSRSTKIFEDNFSPYLITSDRGEGFMEPLSVAYKKGRMTDVPAIFHGLSSPSIADYFLTANAFLELQRPDSAIVYFRALLEADRQHQQHAYEEDTEYYLAMSYLRAGHVAEGLPLFRKIHDDPQHPYHDKVGTWLIRQLRWAH